MIRQNLGLAEGVIPIYEPGLDSLAHRNIGLRLNFSTDLAEAVRGSDVVFIAVGTLTRRVTVMRTCRMSTRPRGNCPGLDGHTVVVTKSTVPGWDRAQDCHDYPEERPDADFDMVSNPEFLREGSAIEDFMRPDRVVIGTDSPLRRGHAAALSSYTSSRPPSSLPVWSRELTKYAANAFWRPKLPLSTKWPTV